MMYRKSNNHKKYQITQPTGLKTFGALKKRILISNMFCNSCVTKPTISAKAKIVPVGNASYFSAQTPSTSTSFEMGSTAIGAKTSIKRIEGIICCKTSLLDSTIAMMTTKLQQHWYIDGHKVCYSF